MAFSPLHTPSGPSSRAASSCSARLSTGSEGMGRLKVYGGRPSASPSGLNASGLRLRARNGRWGGVEAGGELASGDAEARCQGATTPHCDSGAPALCYEPQTLLCYEPRTPLCYEPQTLLLPTLLLQPLRCAPY